VEGLAIFGIELVGFRGRLHLTEVLVEDYVVLLQFKFHVGVAFADLILILDVGDWVNETWQKNCMSACVGLDAHVSQQIMDSVRK